MNSHDENDSFMLNETMLIHENYNKQKIILLHETMLQTSSQNQFIIFMFVSKLALHANMSDSAAQCDQTTALNANISNMQDVNFTLHLSELSMITLIKTFFNYHSI